MIHNRNVLRLFQATTLLLVPLCLEISWSRQVFGILQSSRHLIPVEKDSSYVPPSFEIDRFNSPLNESLQLAWLMSFPNSGTTYTSHFIRKVTGTRTATNYAELRLDRRVLEGLENVESVPVFDSQPTGPFWNDGNETQPESGFVLTKVRLRKPLTFDYVHFENAPPNERSHFNDYV